MRAHMLIYGASFESDILEMLGDVFDDVWVEISDLYTPDNSQSARMQLARITLAAYYEGMDISRLKQSCLEMAQSAFISNRMLRTT